MAEMREPGRRGGPVPEVPLQRAPAADPVCLAEGEKSVGELERLLEMRQPHLSQHLTRLRADGLVMTRRVSRTVYYRLGSEPAERVIGLLYELFCARDAAPAPATDGSPPADDTTRDA